MCSLSTHRVTTQQCWTAQTPRTTMLKRIESVQANRRVLRWTTRKLAPERKAARFGDMRTSVQLVQTENYSLKTNYLISNGDIQVAIKIRWTFAGRRHPTQISRLQRFRRRKMANNRLFVKLKKCFERNRMTAIWTLSNRRFEIGKLARVLRRWALLNAMLNDRLWKGA